MSELYDDVSGKWNSSETQMKKPAPGEETTRSNQDDVAFGQKTVVSSDSNHGATHGDEKHDEIQSPKSAEQKAPHNPPKKQNPFV